MLAAVAEVVVVVFVVVKFAVVVFVVKCCCCSRHRVYVFKCIESVWQLYFVSTGGLLSASVGLQYL